MPSFPWREENEEAAGLISGSSSPSPKARSYYKKHTSLCRIVAFLTFVVLALASIITVVLLRMNPHKHQEIVVSLSLPPQRQTNVTFQPKDIFGREPSVESDKAWDSLFPEGGGYVWFNGTDVPKPPMSESRAVISVFHQLHCLEMIRIGYFAAASGNPEDVDQGPGHLSHCFDYLHQAIMCHGDTTLEWVHEGDPGTSGWGYAHRCHDFAAIFSWVEGRG
ncbi:hypothetical protein ANO14919_101630 [Xylariales sp. No.14919]|nr:hypothetical protein ANO14919_101630 [Xylariales sp. No.14919]